MVSVNLAPLPEGSYLGPPLPSPISQGAEEGRDGRTLARLLSVTVHWIDGLSNQFMIQRPIHWQRPTPGSEIFR